MSKERRDSYRLEIDEGEVLVDVPTGPPHIWLRDLSASGGGLVVPAETARSLLNAPVVVRPDPYPAFQTRVLPVRTIEEDRGLLRIGVRFESLNRTALASLSQFLMQRFEKQSRLIPPSISNPGLCVGRFRRDQVHKMLTFYLLSHKRVLRVYKGKLALPILLRARDLTVRSARQVVVAEVLSGRGNMLDPGGEYTFTFGTSGGISFFESSLWRATAREVVIVMPPQIRQVGFRSSFRVRLDRGDELNLQLQHPRLPDTHLSKRALDISSQGLSFPIRPADDLLFPGEQIRDIAIELPDERIQAEAILRMVTRGVDDELVCGVQIVGFAGRDDEELWQRYVFHKGHPSMSIGAQDQVNSAWTVLESSGYVDETTEELRPHLTRSFSHSWTKHAEKRQLGRYLILHKDNKPIGTVAANLLYPETWLVHHFGIDQKERKADRQRLFKMARDAYCGMQHVLRNLTPLEYFVIYADAGKAWNQMVYGDFMTRFSAREDIVYDSYQVYKCQPETDLGEATVAPQDLEVVESTPELLAMLVDHLENALPQIEIEAFCWSRDRIGLKDFSRRCAADEYERERHLFFAVEDGQPLAALVAETGDEGINIFGLLNKCWFVYFLPEAARDDRVKYHLLRRAVRLYAQKKKKEFILLGSWGGEPYDLLEPLGFHYVADGFRFLGRRAVLPAWMSHVDELMQMMVG